MPWTLLYRLQGNQKNIYYETFLVYFDLILKRNHVNLYYFDCIIKLEHESSIRYVNYCKNFLHFFQQNIRMNGKSINFEDKKINRSNFYKNKKLFNIYDIDIDKILVCKKESYGTKNSLKYFI